MIETKQIKLNVTKSKMYKLCKAVCPELISRKKMINCYYHKSYRESYFIFECNSYSFRLFPCASRVYLSCKNTYDNSEVFNKVIDFDLMKELSFFKVKE